MTPATKKDVENAVEELAQMTQRAFSHVEERMATKEDLRELREDRGSLEGNLREELSLMEGRIDAKLDVLLERFDTVIENHEQPIVALERR